MTAVTFDLNGGYTIATTAASTAAPQFAEAHVKALQAEFAKAKAITLKQPVVPRMIHASFWKAYFQWADGLEKVLKSEQVDDLKIVLRMEEEYQAACTRLDGLMNQWMGSSVQGKPTWQDKAKQAAIPARK